MRITIRHFLRDESGSLVVGEWVFVATILVLGAVAGAAVLHAPPTDPIEDAPASAAVHAPTPPTVGPAAVMNQP